MVGILPWLVPIVVGILAWLQQIPWYLIASSIVITAVFIIIGINQVDTWKERHKKRISKFSDKEIEDTVRGWVDIPGFTFKRLDVDEKVAYFLFMVRDNMDRQVHITRVKENPYYILLGADMSIAPTPDMQKILTVTELTKLKGKLIMEMLRLGCGYDYKPMESGFNMRVYNTIRIDDSLTATAFKEAGAYVTRAFTLMMGVVALTLQEIGITLPTEEESQY